MKHGCIPQVNEYFIQHDRFLALLYKFCLSPVARVKELSTLLVCNGPSKPRGIFVYDGCITCITHYHKAQRTTNQEFHVARFLPFSSGRLMYYYLVYIRHLLLRSCFKISLRSNNLFVADPIVVGRTSVCRWGACCVRAVVQ